MWAPRGSRPTAPKQTAYANLHVLSAVCTATGAAESTVTQGLDTQAVQTFLDQFAAALPEGTHAVLVWDGAGYHSASKALRVPGNITAVTLPPYSPELNPVERLWLYLREHHWSNRVYEDYAALEAAATDALGRVVSDPERIKTVCRCGTPNRQLISRMRISRSRYPQWRK